MPSTVFPAAGLPPPLAPAPAAAAAEDGYRLVRCRLEVELEPAAHRLAARAELTLDGGGGPLRLELHPDLAIEAVAIDGEPAAARQIDAAAAASAAGDGGEEKETPDDEGEAAEATGGPPDPAVYELDRAPAAGGTVTVRYAGRLVEDVAAGERPGRIHNFEVRAHVGPEGIYLSEAVPWYPRPAAPDRPAGEPRGELELTAFELSVGPVPGMLLVASGERQAAAGEPPDGSATWRSPWPLPGLTLAGGPHQAHRRQVGPVLVSVHLLPESAPFAPAILDAAERYLGLYVPRLGPFPYAGLTVVENFFSSGFALPGFTLLASAVIRMGEGGLRPGYLDHELLHNWWGNGVFVSRRDGDWAEALASYAGNYMRPLLEGDAAAARKLRRDTIMGLSRLPGADDQPLATFGEEEGAGRLIGYQKGALVFAQLADRLGEEVAWRALARFFKHHRGQAAGWREIREAFEAESGAALGLFFDYWVRGSGLPEVTLEDAVFDPGRSRLTLTLSRSADDGLPLPVPVRVVGDGTEDEHRLELAGERGSFELEVATPPRAVELDPDYRLLRRLPAALRMPTLSALRPGHGLTVVRAAGDHETYGTVVERLRERFEEGTEEVEDAEEQGGEEQVAEVAGDALSEADLARGHALVLGRAVRAPAAAELLAAGPLRLTAAGFAVEGASYEEPGQAFLCCLNNPHHPGAVVCFYAANGEAGLGNARLLTFYGGSSLLVFDAGAPVVRRDFEARDRYEVRTVASSGP